MSRVKHVWLTRTVVLYCTGRSWTLLDMYETGARWKSNLLSRKHSTMNTFYDESFLLLQPTPQCLQEVICCLGVGVDIHLDLAVLHNQCRVLSSTCQCLDCEAKSGLQPFQCIARYAWKVGDIAA